MTTAVIEHFSSAVRELADAVRELRGELRALSEKSHETQISMQERLHRNEVDIAVIKTKIAGWAIGGGIVASGLFQIVMRVLKL